MPDTPSGHPLVRLIQGNALEVSCPGPESWAGLYKRDYDSAMRQIFAQCAKVADVLVSVSKDPTRNGKLRPLGRDLRLLMEATGWRIVCHHRAILFTELEGGHLFEGTKKRVKGRLSFFKRLSYRKGSPVAQWEDVIFAVRGGAMGGMKAVTSAPWDTHHDRPERYDYWKAGTGKHPGHCVVDDYGSTPGQIGNLHD